jgi:hypothetical protein
MRVEALDGSLTRQIEDVVIAMRAYVGHRSVWLDPFGMLWHSEPEDEDLDAMGHRYIGTFLHPSTDDLCDALAGIGRPQVACLHVAPAHASPPLLVAASA